SHGYQSCRLPLSVERVCTVAQPDLAHLRQAEQNVSCRGMTEKGHDLPSATFDDTSVIRRFLTSRCGATSDETCHLRHSEPRQARPLCLSLLPNDGSHWSNARSRHAHDGTA